MLRICIFQLVIFLLFSITIADQINKNIVFKNIERSIDLTSQLVKINTIVTIENKGSRLVNNILWSSDYGSTGKLVYIAAKDSVKKDLQLKENKIDDYERLFYSISIPNNADQKNIIINVEEVYIDSQVPYPTAITQKENQFVRYFGNHYIYTPYTVSQQITKVLVRTKNIEKYTKLMPFTLADGIITYGPYENIKPFTEDKMIIHFENNSPFLTVTELKRNIEVSHWGNIAIEEHINLLHTGATLKGSFSRKEFQADGNGLNSIKSFKTILPASAERPYYRDFNGNISTSNMKIKKDSVELDLRPRFPLFGGWKTCYTLGYSVPSYQYLFHQGNKFVLKIRLVDHVFDDMKIVDLETIIVLPVGATNIKLRTPYSVERLPDSVIYTYLDTKGRPVISFKKQNLVENHIQDLELNYEWSWVLMIHEPILVSIVFLVLFLIIIVYVRLDFSIYSSKGDSIKKQQ